MAVFTFSAKAQDQPGEGGADASGAAAAEATSPQAGQEEDSSESGQDEPGQEARQPAAVPEAELGAMTVEAVPQIGRYGLDGEYRAFSSSFALGGTQASLRETPFSISSVDEDFLRDVNPTELDEVSTYVPGVQMGNQVNNTAQVFQSRGFQLGRDSILINGTQQADSFAITPDELVSSVEFLRGPSSVLNGQSPPGGAVNIVTKKPLPERFARVTAEYNHHDQRKGAVDVNLGDMDIGGVPASFRLNMMGEMSDSFRDAVERDVGMVAPVLTLRPTDRTTVTFEANIIEWQATDDRGLPLLGGSTDEAAERFDESDFLLGTTDEQNDRDQYRFMLDLSHRFNEHITTNYQVTYGHTERSFFAMFPGAFDPSTNELSRSHFGDEDELESLDTRLDTEFDFETGFLAHRGIAAVQYRDFQRTDVFGGFAPNADTVNVNNPDTDQPFQGTGPGGGPVSEYSAIEGFLQDELRITTGPLEGVSTVLGGRIISYQDDLNSELDEDEFVPRVGLGYTPPPADWLTVYGSYSESFNPQSGTTSSGDPLPPQEGEQWETGVKAEFFNDRLMLTAAYFDLENANVGVRDTTSGDPSDEVAVGLQENRGVELEAVGQLFPNLQVRGQYTHNNGEVVDDPDRAGNELQLTPDHSASIWLRYDLPPFSSFLYGSGEDRVSLAGGVVFVGDRFATTDNQIELTGYARFDVSARYVLNERTEFELNLKNITDERYFTGGNGFGSGSVLPGQPFTVALSLSHKF